MRVPRDNSPRLKRFARDLRTEPTDAEQRLWSRLRQHQLLGERFRRQYPISGYIVDFYNLKNRLAIELDGGQHYDAENIERDKQRDQCLRSLGVTTLRFTNVDVLRDTDAVVEEIAKMIQNLSLTAPTPALPRSTGGGGK